MPFDYLIFLGAFLFCVGLFVVLTRKNAIMVLIGIELMLNAANLNLVAFASFDGQAEGQYFSLFIITIAAAEAAVGLALIIKVYQYFNTANLDEINQLKG